MAVKESAPTDAPGIGRRGESSGKTVAILQSNYVPWKGYFDLMGAADEFILYDDVQYTKHDWRNRNRLKSPAGVRWLTIPVQVKGRHGQRIDEAKVSDPGWSSRHWETIRTWYGRAPFFDYYRLVLEDMYLGSCDDPYLSEVNRRFLEKLRDLLGIATPLTRSSEYPSTGCRIERLLDICHAAGATRYLSGPAAQKYLDMDRFYEDGIEVVWMSYDGYPEYPQLYPPFEHRVSVLDLLLNVGEEAPLYMLGGQ
jgi:hypothetical protein